MILAFSAWWGGAAALGAALAYAALALAASRLSAGGIRGLLLLAWLLHAVTLAEGLLGEPPRFGFAPAISITVWLMLTVYAIESRLFPQLKAHGALAGLGSAAVILSGLLPSQADGVTSAYRAAGLIQRRRIELEGWTSLLLERPFIR